MSEYIINIFSGDEKRQISAPDDKTLLESIRGSGSHIDAPCNGNGTCRQCKVTVSGLCRSADGTVRSYSEEEVLACTLCPAGELTVRTEKAAGSKVLTDEVDIIPSGEGLGLAVDIGTTTVATYLYDLSSGKCIAKKGEMNRQRAYGSDVISRIRHASTEAGLNELCSLIRTQVIEMASAMCPDISRISYVSIAANTVMQHLFAGLSPESIGVAPFTPLSLFGEEEKADKYLCGFAPDAKLYLCPAVAGYVGGDITAGLMSSGVYAGDKSVLFIDIGTNGEMGIGSAEGFLCCATAAGPVFEGAETECCSPARDGAIDTVKDDLSFHVIGDTEAETICGSGIIDAVAALLKHEIIDETGRMEDDERYHFSEKAYISAQDIRKIQLAKAAIRAGIETLLQRSGKSYDDIESVLIAGGFGAYMKIRSACAIGLLPPDLMAKTRHVGNSAGKGAAMALAPEGRAILAEISAKCAYEELSSSALFNDNYIDAMMFEEWEEVL
ncbi:MAG: DUF4445 domain-containing protein [Oscillospiraceae bacterium]|nr:DUF4445 domain-containing protein [Oscillospiraceae bacterium]